MILNIMYLLGALIFITIGNIAQSINFEIGLFITEYIIVLGIALFIIKFSNAKISDYLKLNKVSMKVLIKTILIAILSIPIVMILNLFSMYILELFGKSIPTSIPMATNFTLVIIQFLLISVSAGICEEFLFRGVILNTYLDYFSYGKAIVITAILFGIFHFNIQNILGPIYLGIIFGYLVLKTNSIIPAILGHMLNNGIAYVLSYIGTLVDVAEVNIEMSAPVMLDLIFNLSFVSAFSLALILLLLKSVHREIEEKEKMKLKASYFIPIGIVFLMYIGYSYRIFM